MPPSPPNAAGIRATTREGLSHLAELAEATPLGARGAAVVAGLMLLFAGARIYRLAIAAPGFFAGIVLSSTALHHMSATPTVAGLDENGRTIVVLLAGVAGALLTGYVEQLAVRLAGGLMGGMLVIAAWPMLQGGAGAPLWASLAGLGAGLLLFPSLYRRLLQVLSPILGAMAIAWAAGHPENLLLISGLTVVGAIFQLNAGKAR